MRTSYFYRALVAAWGFWFTAAVTDAGVLHTCPTHGSHIQASADAHSHGTPDSGSDQLACTCLGTCCATAPIASPAPTDSFFPVATVSVADRDFADVASPSVDRTYVLPFANGPPALR